MFNSKYIGWNAEGWNAEGWNAEGWNAHDTDDADLRRDYDYFLIPKIRGHPPNQRHPRSILPKIRDHPPNPRHPRPILPKIRDNPPNLRHPRSITQKPRRSFFIGASPGFKMAREKS